jgi:hypothetical protein
LLYEGVRLKLRARVKARRARTRARTRASIYYCCSYLLVLTRLYSQMSLDLGVGLLAS